MNVLRMADQDLAGKRVLIREDLNVPVEGGKVTSDARIRASLPTIQLALDKGAKVFVTSHLGRPEEGVYAEEFSLAPVAARLSELVRQARAAARRTGSRGVDTAPGGSAVLLENVRFNKGEKKDKEDLARQMAGAVRRVCHGRVRHGASRRGIDAWRRQVRQGRLCRPAAGG